MKMVGFADETVVGGGESVGARLRQAREAHGFSLDDISARTRVPTRHLKAIEEDAFDQLPAAPSAVAAGLEAPSNTPSLPDLPQAFIALLARAGVK